MKRFCFLLLFTIIGCSSNVHFIKTDETFVERSKSADARIVFRQNKIGRPHRVIGVIEAELDKKARRPELDALLIKKAKEIGADGVMLVEYDIDRQRYVERHHTIVGRGPYRRRVVHTSPRVAVKKSATGIAVIFR